MARIVTVYTSSRNAWDLRDMSYIRWQKISEALSRLGHQVDIATNEPGWTDDPTPVIMGPRLRRIPLANVVWRKYDVVKTLFHLGFRTLASHGGTRHPFIISKLGSVVGSEDMPGIYFYGQVRQKLFATQVEINRTSRYITVLSPAARDLWRQVHGRRNRMLLVPGGVDHDIPEPSANPYEKIEGKVCIFSGNIYTSDSQPEANRVLVDKLNQLGQRLRQSGITLCFQGLGDATRLDERFVINLGSCSLAESWNYLQHANVGIVVSAGPFMHNNESTKIYHYLRAGLPVVSEQGFPNDRVVHESGLGFVVPAEDMDGMATKIIEGCYAEWERARAIRYIQANHTWDCRAQIYKDIIPRKPRMFTLQRTLGIRVPWLS
jgi:glycosyltransferase involved in cell wall biosynthesis